MTTETSVTNLKINKLTKAQFDTITPSNTEVYELTDLSTILDGKQATLVSGTNIKTINNESLLGNGNITIQGGGGSVAIDNSTITKNASDQLQTVAVKDNRTGNALKLWTGLKSNAPAVGSRDANTLYNIIDDTDVTLPLLELLYPVGAIYIGTMNACPLQVLGVGTWSLVASDRVLQGAGSGTVGSTVEAGLPNITGLVDSGCVGEVDYLGGAFLNSYAYGSNPYAVTSSSIYKRGALFFDASRSNPIYSNSTTVQPPAYLVNIWERIS